MKWSHYGFLLAVFVAGYVFARFYPQLGAKVGLP